MRDCIWIVEDKGSRFKSDIVFSEVLPVFFPRPIQIASQPACKGYLHLQIMSIYVYVQIIPHPHPIGRRASNPNREIGVPGRDHLY